VSVGEGVVKGRAGGEGGSGNVKLRMIGGLRRRGFEREKGRPGPGGGSTATVARTGDEARETKGKKLEGTKRGEMHAGSERSSSKTLSSSNLGGAVDDEKEKLKSGGRLWSRRRNPVSETEGEKSCSGERAKKSPCGATSDKAPLEKRRLRGLRRSHVSSPRTIFQSHPQEG